MNGCQKLNEKEAITNCIKLKLILLFLQYGKWEDTKAAPIRGNQQV